MASRVDTHTQTHAYTHTYTLYTHAHIRMKVILRNQAHTRLWSACTGLKSNFPDKILIPTLNIYRGGYYNCADMISTSFTALEKITDELTLCLSR